MRVLILGAGVIGTSTAWYLTEQGHDVVVVALGSCSALLTRLGRRLRIAGTAELSGYSTDLNPVRCQALTRRAMEIFPGAAEFGKAAFWTGLRPSTPSNVPLIGPTKIPNLYLDTGHGTLGWTMACGSGRALADIIPGRKPEIPFPFTR